VTSILDRLTDAMSAAASTVRDEELRPLVPPPRRRRPPAGGRRWRQPAWAVPVAAAIAVALVIGLAVSVSNGLFGTLRPAGPTHLPAAPRQFNPLIPYVSFGWLPAGQSLSSGEVRPTQIFLTAGSTGLPGWGLNVYARGQCHLTRPPGGLQCPHQGLDGTTARFKFTAPAPAVDAHRAFWAGTGLVWQYARDGWAALTWPASAPGVRTPRQDTVRTQRQAIKIAGHLRFGAATPLVFPAQLTGLTTQWQISDVYYLPDAGVLRAESFMLTTSTSRYLSHVGDLGVWTNAPYVEIHPAPRNGTCTPHDPASKNTSEIINGYRVVVKRMPIGGVPQQELCAAHADGFWLSIIEFGPHPSIDVASLFRHHMRLLGTNPANWTSHPLI
jgi:hypothetical protein